MAARTTLFGRSTSLLAAAPLLLLAACQVYDPPPVPSVVGAKDGLVPAGQPGLEVQFSEPVDPATLRLSVVLLAADAEGDLGDEDESKKTALTTYFSHDPGKGDTGGKGSMKAADTVFRIVPDVPFPVGPTLAILIEEGLSDNQGNDTGARIRLPFAYRFVCQGGKGTQLPSGAYFFLFDIQKPIPVQIQILADVRVDAETGTLLSQFTNADRNPDPDRCPFPCKDTEVCRLLPEPKCAAASDPAGSVDEYSDFVPHPEPPSGYSFTVDGCAEDGLGGTAALATEPTDLVVQKPPVQAVKLSLTCSFTPAEDGALRCTGNCGAEDVIIGDMSAGAAEGTSRGRLIPPEDAPEDLPAPPEH